MWKITDDPRLPMPVDDFEKVTLPRETLTRFRDEYEDNIQAMEAILNLPRDEINGLSIAKAIIATAGRDGTNFENLNYVKSERLRGIVLMVAWLMDGCPGLTPPTGGGEDE